jgi:hypothetical protein
LVPSTTRFVNHGGDIHPVKRVRLRTAAHHLLIAARGPPPSVYDTGQRIHNLFEGLRRTIDHHGVRSGHHRRDGPAFVALIVFGDLT